MLQAQCILCAANSQGISTRRKQNHVQPTYTSLPHTNVHKYINYLKEVQSEAERASSQHLKDQEHSD
jgi:hypothetical protein